MRKFVPIRTKCYSQEEDAWFGQEVSRFVHDLATIPPTGWDQFRERIPIAFLERLIYECLMQFSTNDGATFVRCFLKFHYCYKALGHFLINPGLAQLTGVDPEIFERVGDHHMALQLEAAEIFEKIKDYQMALKIYEEGVQVWDPKNIDYYDEKIGGSISLYKTGIQPLIEDALQKQEIFRQKAEELKKKLCHEG